MEEFPNEVELKVANALLLLSHSPTTPSLQLTSRDKLWKETCASMEKSLERKKLRERKTSSCNSTLTTENSFRSPCSMIKLKVARRARSKVIYLSSSDKKPSPSTCSKPPLKAVMSSQTTTEASCLSTGGTSEISSVTKRSSSGEVEQKNRRRLGPAHIRRRAEAIIKFLSLGGCASEVHIRKILGDSPDTSKALRMLLRMDKVKRRGAGGRNDPFIYMMAAITADRQAAL